MALTVSLSLVDAMVVAQRPATFQVNILNTSASSVTLSTLIVSEATEAELKITQPNFLTPNVAVGVGNPTILGGATASYTFDVVAQTPNGPGTSPAQPGIGVAGSFVGQPPTDGRILQATAVASDGSVGSASLAFAPLSSIAPFPPVATGSLQLQFSSGFDLIGLAVGL